MSKVLVFYPIISNNGAKFTATNFAFAYSKKYKNKKIALVDFDFKNPGTGRVFLKGNKGIGIDNIIEKINSAYFDEKIFIGNMFSINKNIDILYGTDNYLDYKNITEEQVETILSELKKHYDYVLINVNSDSDNAGTVYSLLNSDEIIMVVRNNYANLIKLDYSLKLIVQYKNNEKPLRIIYNFYNENSTCNGEIGKIIGDRNTSILGYYDYDGAGVDNIDFTKTIKLGSKKNFSRTLKMIKKLESRKGE
jgi:MinD-like ATPase involved in chromosome partitioning or flagellar assembly